MASLTTNWMRNLALVLAGLWAGWWTFFGLASGLAEGLDLVGVVVHLTVPGLIFLLSVAAAWRWQGPGGGLLLLEGLLVLIGYPLLAAGRMTGPVIIMVLLTMALPPLISGSLCLLCWRRARSV